MNKKFSQNDEEAFILDYFSDKPTGRFMDIGAFDVYQFSNVRALYEKGWGGILVEPAPKQFNSIYEHYKDDPKITTLNMAIGTSYEEIDFYVSEDAVSTSDVAHMTKWANAGVSFEKIRVPQVNVVDFMKEHCIGIDFLSIDTEATNMAIFRAIPDFVFEQIKMFCIEHDGLSDEVEDRTRDFGFYPLYFNGENILLAK